eukprot:4638646-Pleurochrysis_carterae.AAC.3
MRHSISASRRCSAAVEELLTLVGRTSALQSIKRHTMDFRYCNQEDTGWSPGGLLKATPV